MSIRYKSKDYVVLTVLIFTFLIVIGISLSLISGMRINSGDSNIRSDKDLTCYFTIDQNSNVNVTWYKNGVQNLTATISCNNGVECYTSLGSGTVPNSYISKGEVWTCEASFYNGTGTEVKNISVNIVDSPPTQPRIFYLNGTEIINTTVVMEEDSTLNLNVNSTDKDGDSITYIMNDTTFCSINPVSGAMSCTPASLSQTGFRTIRIGADTSLASTYQFLSINVTAIPKFVPPLTNQNLVEGQVLNYYITIEDDGSRYPVNVSLMNITPYLNLTISQVNNNTFVLMMQNNRTVTFSEARLGNYSITLRVNDTPVSGSSKNSTGSFKLIGVSNNHLANISYIVYNNASLTQGGSVDIYVNATDIDNQTLIFSTGNILYPITYNSSTDFGSIVPNSSFAYAYINVSNLTNNHVVNHDFSVYVFDTSQNSTQLITMFIANTNDAPFIAEISADPINTLGNTNISKMTGYTDVLFKYKVNASDIDDLTYDTSNTGLGTYSTNDSNYGIDVNTGLISFVPNSTGNFTFTVTVTDKGGLSYNRTAKIEVLPNRNPIFTQTPIDIICKEYDAANWPINCTYNMSANVSDLDPGDYVANYWINSTIFEINSTTGIINFRPNMSTVGNTTIQLNITDTRGGMNSTIINLNVSLTNHPPIMYAPNMPLSSNLIVGTPYQITYTANDSDLFRVDTFENLTFTSNITGPNTSVFSLTQISASQASLLITPINTSYEGNYSINVTVTDYYGNSSSHHMYIYIYNVTAKPTIIQVIPSGTPFNSTIDNVSWMNASSFPGMTTSVGIYENQTFLFNITAVADNSSYPNHVDYEWYVDNVLSGTTQSHQKYFDFFSSGQHSMAVVVRDQYGSNNSFNWVINVVNVNRGPIYYNYSLENLSVGGSIAISDYMDYSAGRTRFYDPDDDPGLAGHTTGNQTSLIFSSTVCPYANFSFDYGTLTISAGEIGECNVVFSATDAFDPTLQVSSQMVSINITNVTKSISIVEVPITSESSGGTTTQPLPIPLPQEVDRPKPLQIITPKLVTTYKNATLKIPIIINNTWNATLVGITLEATTNATNVSLYLDRIYITKLNPGESVEATLYVMNYKSEGHYEIQITGNVTIPAYQDTASIYINSAEMKSVGEELESKISFAKDLLSSNPECQELNELLLEAQKELANSNYESTAKIVDNVLNGCKYLVNNAKNNTETPSRDFLKTFEWQKSYTDYSIIGLFAMLFIGALYYILKKDNPEQNF